MVICRPAAWADRRQAGADGLAVEQHRAGAAIAGIAADLGAGQPQILAQHLRQPAHRRRCDGRQPAVDGQAQLREIGSPQALLQVVQRTADQLPGGIEAVVGGAAHVGQWRQRREMRR